MLLSINPKKVQKELANSRPSYLVSPCNFESAQNPVLESPSIQGASTLVGISPELEQFRDRVQRLRQHIVDRGEPLASSPEELEHVIDEMRGRV